MGSILDFGRQVYHWFRPTRNANSERQWRRFAKTVTRRTFAIWLAEQVAADMMRSKPLSLGIDEISLAVLQAPASVMQHQAELFLEKYYFDYPFEHEEFLAYVTGFRQLIQQNLLRLDIRTPTDPMADAPADHP